MDRALNRLIKNLLDGKENIKSGARIESEISISRKEITDSIIANNLPIGSTSKGYFFINVESEFQEVIDLIDARINGLLRRKHAITQGWEKRKNYRKEYNSNWPKDKNDL